MCVNIVNCSMGDTFSDILVTLLCDILLVCLVWSDFTLLLYLMYSNIKKHSSVW